MGILYAADSHAVLKGTRTGGNRKSGKIKKEGRGLMEKLFKLKENGTTVGREVIAGLTTFFAMAYIIAD